MSMPSYPHSFRILFNLKALERIKTGNGADIRTENHLLKQCYASNSIGP